MKQLQIDWAQFIRALITVAAMVVAFPLLCVAALVSVIIDEHTEARSRKGQK